MTAIPDLLYVALFAAVMPLIDYAVFWPAFRRLSEADPAWARRWLCASAIVHPWTLVVLGAALWMASHRSWALLGFTVPAGWRLWAACILAALLVAWLAASIVSVARSAEARESLDSLWPAIVLHALLDLGQGAMAWLALREQPAQQDGPETAWDTALHLTIAARSAYPHEWRP